MKISSLYGYFTYMQFADNDSCCSDKRLGSISHVETSVYVKLIKYNNCVFSNGQFKTCFNMDNKSMSVLLLI